MKKLIFFTVFLSLNMAFADCDVVQVISKDPESNQVRRGNGFAYTEKHIVVNDHTLAPGAQIVQLKRGAQNYVARVLNRDFHTDLALLMVDSNSFSACTLKNLSEMMVTVKGYDQLDTAISSVPAVVKTAGSTKLMVPGVVKAIEFVASGRSELRGSQSGSVLLSQDAVVGFVTQKTNEGTALAMSSQDIDKTIRQMMQNQLPKRNYEVDRRTNTYRFDGLKIEPKSGSIARTMGGVNPHEGIMKANPHEGILKSTNPHEGITGTNPYSNNPKLPQPIALEDYDVGAVLATVEDFSLLAQKQPGLAKALRDARVNKVFISMIDGVSIKSTLDLLRVLGTCTDCKIESFWIEVKNPEQVTDTTLKTMGWLSALILELEKDNTKEKVRTIVDTIQDLNPLLAKILNESQNARVDLTTKQILKTKWMAIEKKLEVLWHSEKTLDILAEIRKELL